MNYEEKEMEIFSRVYAGAISFGNDPKNSLHKANIALETFRIVFPKKEYLSKIDPIIILDIQPFTTSSPCDNSPPMPTPISLKNIVGFTDISDVANTWFLSKQEALFVSIFNIQTIVYLINVGRLFSYEKWTNIDDACFRNGLPFVENVVNIPLKEVTKNKDMETQYLRLCSIVNDYRNQLK